MWRLSTETIIVYSNNPPRLAAQSGFLMAIFSICNGKYIHRPILFHDSPIHDLNSLIFSLFFIGSIIIDVYLGKTFGEIQKFTL